MASKTLTINHAGGGSETYTVNRDKFAGVRQMSRGHVYPATPVSEESQSYNGDTVWEITKTDDRNFRVFSNLAIDGSNNAKFKKIVPNEILRMGRQRITFDVTLNGSTVASDITNFMFRLSYRDDQTNLNPVVGSNTFDIDLYDDGTGHKPEIYFAFHQNSSYDISITNLKVTHEPDTITTNHTAVPKEQSRETTFGGTQSITIKRDIEPLLDKVVGGASAAYSLRDLNDKAGNSKVVKVRRSSDQAEKTFTAKEVPQIADWVNENDSGDVIGFTLSGSGDSDADGVYTLKRYVSGRPQFNKTHPDGSIWFFYVLSGSSGYWRLRVFESDPNDAPEDPADTVLDGVIEDTDYPWETTYINKNPVFSDLTVDASDGFVETWYDQSGNGNDATQPVEGSQPKIVDGGSLLADGIDFSSGVNLKLSGTGLDIFKNVSYGQIFSVIKPRETGTGNRRYFEASVGTGSDARFLLGDGQDTAGTFRIGGRRLDGDSFGDEESPTGHSNQLSIITGFLNYTDAEGFLFLNGAQVATNSIPNMTAGNTSDTSSDLVTIGATTAVNTAPFNAKELIIYDSDQSANRPAIEKNINNHYEIF